MASIRYRKRKDGTVAWQVLYRHKGRQAAETFDTQKGADWFLKLVDDFGAEDALRIQRERETLDESHAPRLEDWCMEYIESIPSITEGTRDSYRRYVRNDLGALGKLPVDTITRTDVAKWVNALAFSGLGGKTISNKHGFLSGAMKAAVRSRIVDFNPCEGTRLPRTETSEPCFLTADEFATLLKFVRPDAHDFVAMLPATGLRFSELSALQPRDVDLGAGLLTVSRSHKRVPGCESVLGPPKTKRSRRTIALPKQAVTILERNMAGRGKEDFIFTNKADGFWHRSRFHKGVWQPATREAQEIIGKKPRVHDMRHTCASWMIRAGLPLPVIQRHLGHESIQTTIDVYGHLEPAHLAMAAGALGQFMTPSMPLDVDEVEAEVEEEEPLQIAG